MGSFSIKKSNQRDGAALSRGQFANFANNAYAGANRIAGQVSERQIFDIDNL